jgi:hypothetical protein
VRLPKEVELYVNLLDPLLRRRLRKFDQWKQERTPTGRVGEVQWMKSIAARSSWRIGRHQGQEVVYLLPQPKAQVPVVAGKGRITPLVVGGIVGKGSQAGVYEVVLIQRQPDGGIGASAGACDGGSAGREQLNTSTAVSRFSTISESSVFYAPITLCAA